VYIMLNVGSVVHRYCKVEQFLEGDKFETIDLKFSERRRHRLDRSGVNVVGQDDRAGPRFFKNSIANYSRTGPFPIEWINIPKDNVVSKFIVDPSFFPFRDRSIGRPKQGGPVACGALDCIIGSL